MYICSLFGNFAWFLQVNGTHHHILFVLSNFICNVNLLFVASGTYPLFLILESFNVVTGRRTLVTNQESTLSAVVSSTQEIKSLFANFAVFLDGVRDPLRSWGNETIQLGRRCHHTFLLSHTLTKCIFNTSKASWSNSFLTTSEFIVNLHFRLS